MSFLNYTPITKINSSKIKWTIRVRAQAIWKGINRETKELRGINIIFVDDCNSRIHAFLNARYAMLFEKDLKEGQIYNVSNFVVHHYNGTESHRCVRYSKHIYFAEYTKIEKISNEGLPIPEWSFDLHQLVDLENMEGNTSYLCDVIGIITNTEPVRQYVNDNSEPKTQKKFCITDGRCSVRVTFFDQLAESIEEAFEKEVNESIIIISSAKIGRFQGELNITNYPATRFYLNINHYSVKQLRNRALEISLDSKLPATDIHEDQNSKFLSIMEIKQLTEKHKEKQVVCQVTVKKVEQTLPWYYNVCCDCDKELNMVDGRYQCNQCKRFFLWPDRRFRIFTLCSDVTGGLPIILEDREVRRLTGKTVFDVSLDQAEGGNDDKFPAVLLLFLNKDYTITLSITGDNVEKGSQIYKACDIVEGHELFASNTGVDIASTTNAEYPTAIATEICTAYTLEETPNTKMSATKPRVRKSPETEVLNAEDSITINKLMKNKSKKGTIPGKSSTKPKAEKYKNSQKVAQTEEIPSSEAYNSDEHISLNKLSKLKKTK